MPTDDAVTCDYAVIGSGAGGGITNSAVQDLTRQTIGRYRKERRRREQNRRKIFQMASEKRADLY